MIELQNVSAGYGKRPVLREVSITFQPGEVLAIVGPNGCGKSTLLRAALGILPHGGGHIWYDGILLEKLPAREVARKAAFLTQCRDTPGIRAERLVLHGRFPWMGFPGRYTKKDTELARAAMKRTGVLGLSQCPLPALSGGQRQNVYLAMLLAQKTQTLFMDEPATYLDIANQLSLLSMAAELAEEGRAVAMVLHDITMALKSADRIAVMQEGSLLCCAKPEEIYDSGILDRVFHIRLKRFRTEEGWQYYT